MQLIYVKDQIILALEYHQVGKQTSEIEVTIKIYPLLFVLQTRIENDL